MSNPSSSTLEAAGIGKGFQRGDKEHQDQEQEQDQEQDQDQKQDENHSISFPDHDSGNRSTIPLNTDTSQDHSETLSGVQTVLHLTLPNVTYFGMSVPLPGSLSTIRREETREISRNIMIKKIDKPVPDLDIKNPEPITIRHIGEPVTVEISNLHANQASKIHAEALEESDYDRPGTSMTGHSDCQTPPPPPVPPHGIRMPTLLYPLEKHTKITETRETQRIYEEETPEDPSIIRSEIREKPGKSIYRIPVEIRQGNQDPIPSSTPKTTSSVNESFDRNTFERLSMRRRSTRSNQSNHSIDKGDAPIDLVIEVAREVAERRKTSRSSMGKRKETAEKPDKVKRSRSRSTGCFEACCMTTSEAKTRVQPIDHFPPEPGIIGKRDDEMIEVEFSTQLPFTGNTFRCSTGKRKKHKEIKAHPLRYQFDTGLEEISTVSIGGHPAEGSLRRNEKKDKKDHKYSKIFNENEVKEKKIKEKKKKEKGKKSVHVNVDLVYETTGSTEITLNPIDSHVIPKPNAPAILHIPGLLDLHKEVLETSFTATVPTVGQVLEEGDLESTSSPESKDVIERRIEKIQDGGGEKRRDSEEVADEMAAQLFAHHQFEGDIGKEMEERARTSVSDVPPVEITDEMIDKIFSGINDSTDDSSSPFSTLPRLHADRSGHSTMSVDARVRRQPGAITVELNFKRPIDEDPTIHEPFQRDRSGSAFARSYKEHDESNVSTDSMVQGSITDSGTTINVKPAIKKSDSQKDGFQSPIVEARKTYKIIGVSRTEREAIPVEQISLSASITAQSLKQQTRVEEIEEEQPKLAELAEIENYVDSDQNADMTMEIKEIIVERKREESVSELDIERVVAGICVITGESPPKGTQCECVSCEAVRHFINDSSKEEKKGYEQVLEISEKLKHFGEEKEITKRFEEIKIERTEPVEIDLNEIFPKGSPKEIPDRSDHFLQRSRSAAIQRNTFSPIQRSATEMKKPIDKSLFNTIIDMDEIFHPKIRQFDNESNDPSKENLSLNESENESKEARIVDQDPHEYAVEIIQRVFSQVGFHCTKDEENKECECTACRDSKLPAEEILKKQEEFATRRSRSSVTSPQPKQTPKATLNIDLDEVFSPTRTPILSPQPNDQRDNLLSTDNDTRKGALSVAETITDEVFDELGPPTRGDSRVDEVEPIGDQPDPNKNPYSFIWDLVKEDDPEFRERLAKIKEQKSTKSSSNIEQPFRQTHSRNEIISLRDLIKQVEAEQLQHPQMDLDFIANIVEIRKETERLIQKTDEKTQEDVDKEQLENVKITVEKSEIDFDEVFRSPISSPVSPSRMSILEKIEKFNNQPTTVEKSSKVLAVKTVPRKSTVPLTDPVSIDLDVVFQEKSVKLGSIAEGEEVLATEPTTAATVSATVPTPTSSNEQRVKPEEISIPPSDAGFDFHALISSPQPEKIKEHVERKPSTETTPVVISTPDTVPVTASVPQSSHEQKEEDREIPVASPDTGFDFHALISSPQPEKIKDQKEVESDIVPVTLTQTWSNKEEPKEIPTISSVSDFDFHSLISSPIPNQAEIDVEIVERVTSTTWSHARQEAHQIPTQIPTQTKRKSVEEAQEDQFDFHALISSPIQKPAKEPEEIQVEVVEKLTTTNWSDEKQEVNEIPTQQSVNPREPEGYDFHSLISSPIPTIVREEVHIVEIRTQSTWSDSRQEAHEIPIQTKRKSVEELEKAHDGFDFHALISTPIQKPAKEPEEIQVEVVEKSDEKQEVNETPTQQSVTPREPGGYDFHSLISSPIPTVVREEVHIVETRTQSSWSDARQEAHEIPTSRRSIEVEQPTKTDHGFDFHALISSPLSESRKEPVQTQTEITETITTTTWSDAKQEAHEIPKQTKRKSVHDEPENSFDFHALISSPHLTPVKGTEQIQVVETVTKDFHPTSTRDVDENALAPGERKSLDLDLVFNSPTPLLQETRPNILDKLANLDKLDRPVSRPPTRTQVTPEPRARSVASLPPSEISLEEIFSRPSTSAASEHVLLRSKKISITREPIELDYGTSMKEKIARESLDLDLVFNSPISLQETRPDILEKLNRPIERSISRPVTRAMISPEPPRARSVASLPPSDINLDEIFNPKQRRVLQESAVSTSQEISQIITESMIVDGEISSFGQPQNGEKSKIAEIRTKISPDFHETQEQMSKIDFDQIFAEIRTVRQDSDEKLDEKYTVNNVTVFTTPSWGKEDRNGTVKDSVNIDFDQILNEKKTSYGQSTENETTKTFTVFTRNKDESEMNGNEHLIESKSYFVHDEHQIPADDVILRKKSFNVTEESFSSPTTSTKFWHHPIEISPENQSAQSNQSDRSDEQTFTSHLTKEGPMMESVISYGSPTSPSQPETSIYEKTQFDDQPNRVTSSASVYLNETPGKQQEKQQDEIDIIKLVFSSSPSQQEQLVQESHKSPPHTPISHHKLEKASTSTGISTPALSPRVNEKRGSLTAAELIQQVRPSDNELLEVEVDDSYFIVKGSYSLAILRTDPLGQLLTSLQTHSQGGKCSFSDMAQLDFSLAPKLRKLLYSCLKEKKHRETYPTLSTRAQHLVANYDQSSMIYQRMFENHYDVETNPQGNVNLCTAENNVCEDLLREKCIDWMKPEQLPTGSIDLNHLVHYGPAGGYLSVKQALLRYFVRFMDAQRITADDILLAPGSNCAHDMVTFATMQPDELLIANAPIYTRIYNNVEERAECRLVTVPFKNITNPSLDIEALNRAIFTYSEEGEAVRGVVIVNPHNPLGITFPEEQMIELCEWANGKGLFVIVDEVFSGTIYGPRNSFRPFLSYRHKLTNPHKTAWIWSPSKDFGLPGIRLASIVCTDPAIARTLIRMEVLQPCSALAQDFTTRLLDDPSWISWFHGEKLARLRVHRSSVVQTLAHLHIPFVDGVAGVTLFCDFSRFLPKYKDEDALINALADRGVFITPGKVMGEQRPGWVRLVFACQKDELYEGLKRLVSILGSDPSFQPQEIVYETTGIPEGQ